MTPIGLATGYKGQSLSAYTFAKSLHEETDLARASLDKAAMKMNKWADFKRRAVEFNEGDRVMVKLLPQQFKAFRSVHKGLIRWYEGPFKIVRQVGNVSYRVEFPSKMKIYPMFHVSQLKPYHEDTKDPTRGQSSRAPTAVTTSFDKEVEEVISHREVRRLDVPPYKEYFVRWNGLPDSESTWEHEEHLWQIRDRIEEYHAKVLPRMASTYVGENVTPTSRGDQILEVSRNNLEFTR